MDINGKTILVTGGTGSFGNKFIEHLLADFSIKCIVIYSRDELKQFEQAALFNDPRLNYIIGDVRDRERLTTAMNGVDLVVHAAAMKQVVASERNPSECIRTNVGGAENVIEAALANRIERVVALSTDKAVNPINLYGATKLCSDKLFINANRRSPTTQFSVVRYGNVIGSRGSVVPFFRTRRVSGKLPITDERMTRFWISLHEGVRFVSRCMSIMRGGEVFISKIPSMKIVDLATAIAPECEQVIIGIRPGEKLHEVMVPVDEARRTLEFAKFFVIAPDEGSGAVLEEVSYDGELGARVAEDFEYSSHTNKNWVSVEELRQIVPEQPE
jgi:UDP-N-acetylglucosamine 4,6-dehydratase/5-epimerase